MINSRGKTAGRSGNRQTISNAELRRIFKHMVYGCICCKITPQATGDPAGFSVIAYNDAMVRLCGDVTTENINAFLAQADSSVLTRVAMSGISCVWEQFCEFRQKWFSVSAFAPEKHYVVLLFEDITARKLLKKELEEGRKRYEALLKQSSDAIALFDSVSKRVIEVNERLCSMTGYSEEELCGMDIYTLFADSPPEIDVCQAELVKKRYLPATTRLVNCKGGPPIEVERVVSLINYNSHQLELMTLYDISEDRRLQQIIKDEAALAGQVQRQMLPADVKNEIVEIKGIFKPLHMVSGDFFDYRLSADKKSLTGFLVDVAGHGLATGLQTAAINVLLQDTIIHEKMPTNEELQLLNKRMASYFNEGSFAALLIFHFDFVKRSLCCACCGINQLLTFSGMKRGWIKNKGSIMGTFDNPKFDFIKVPVQPGDCFYFLTDGISDRLEEKKYIFDNLDDFTATIKMLNDLASSPGATDDCSAVCVKLGEANSCRYYFSGLDDVATIQKHIRRVLEEMAGDKALYLEIAINEAINNILIHGSGNGFFTIRKVGQRIVLRIKDRKQGFNAKAILDQYTKSPEDFAEEFSARESGRGCFIMRLFTDKIYCNQAGSEIMLVYHLAQSTSL